ncbi:MULTISPECIES: NAD(P)H-dependent oxidoreductase subunit E [unclassified Oceanispirochaeta]|uniref:NADH-quinone oxidoreductase subunit NuoE family protein n=1 Tax=unclassified Oceanispirochaeta TaxID=2635722 RepID=UPI000E08FA70|nr:MULTISPECIES: NAD(P)H-dependent oxidoreductase subunit E [unclassified Oceanispirochaeta]MBF9018397.1 NAD(P)H-dependent oxidoreductase subunit E [Oceanispirochaeta sp. M2]NPD75209.1 NAD(P)H-dependent oxidoreductase subunit E [Oceanispirochaeta sp. M1]RDG28927.1 NAD(P)H-dependent oxidoreductase subunit E [Oceanispirochaeta sp. M1]
MVKEKKPEIEESLSQEEIQELDKLIDKHGADEEQLIPLLEKVQVLLGYIPVSVQERISNKTGIPPNHIYGVVSFYSYFSMEAKARHRIQVCMGTACYVKGGKEIAEKIEADYNIKLGESTEDGRFTYENARCFGACGLAPILVVDGKIFGKVSIDSVDAILDEYK